LKSEENQCADINVIYKKVDLKKKYKERCRNANEKISHIKRFLSNLFLFNKIE